jgi:hypothetical protein
MANGPTLPREQSRRTSPTASRSSTATANGANPQTRHIAGSRTKILVVAARRDPDLARRLAAVIDAYKTEFHQQSVGIITRDSCGAF